MNKPANKKKHDVIPYMDQPHAPLMPQISGIPGVTAAQGVTSTPTQLPGIVSGNLTVTGAVSANNLSGTNTGDITLGTANGLSLAGQVLSYLPSSTTAPSLAGSAPTFTDYYGGGANALGSPVARMSIIVGGITYKIPLYS